MAKRRKSAPRTPPDSEPPIIERPDGFYWQSREGRDYGPFASLAEAEADREYAADTDYEPGETLEEAEDEIGVSGWVDPDTGELSEEERPRLEDH